MQNVTGIIAAAILICEVGIYMGYQTEVSQAEDMKEKREATEDINTAVKPKERENRSSETTNIFAGGTDENRQKESRQSTEKKEKRIETENSSKPSPNSVDNSSAGKTETPAQPHTHSWEHVYETKIITEEIPIIGDRCNTCGQDIKGFAEQHILTGSCTGYSSEGLKEMKSLISERIHK